MARIYADGENHRRTFRMEHTVACVARVADCSDAAEVEVQAAGEVAEKAAAEEEAAEAEAASAAARAAAAASAGVPANGWLRVAQHDASAGVPANGWLRVASALARATAGCIIARTHRFCIIASASSLLLAGNVFAGSVHAAAPPCEAMLRARRRLRMAIVPVGKWGAVVSVCMQGRCKASVEQASDGNRTVAASSSGAQASTFGCMHRPPSKPVSSAPRAASVSPSMAVSEPSRGVAGHASSPNPSSELPSAVVGASAGASAPSRAPPSAVTARAVRLPVRGEGESSAPRAVVSVCMQPLSPRRRRVERSSRTTTCCSSYEAIHSRRAGKTGSSSAAEAAASVATPPPPPPLPLARRAPKTTQGAVAGVERSRVYRATVLFVLLVPRRCRRGARSSSSRCPRAAAPRSG